MTKCEKLSGHFRFFSHHQRGHDHELGIYVFRATPYNAGLIVSLAGRNTGIPRAVRIDITQRQARAFGRNPKVSHRIVLHIYPCNILTLFSGLYRIQNPIRGMSAEGGQA